MIIYCVHQYLFMLPAPFCSTLLSLQLGKKSDKNIYNEREKKLKIVEKQLFSIFFLFCLSAFLFFWMFFFLSYVVFFFFVLFRLISQRTVPNDEQQTNKQKKISNHISQHCTVSERFWGWNGELSSEQLDEHRRGVGGGGRRSIKFMRGVKVQKVQEDRGWLRS